MEDEAIINEKLEKMSAIFREPTPELFRELFTEDCDYITFNGRHLKGIEENLRAHQQLAGLRLFRGAELLWESRQIRLLNPDTAVTIVTGGIKFRWQKKLSKRRRSINTNVFVRRQNGDWKLASFQNSRIQPPGF